MAVITKDKALRYFRDEGKGGCLAALFGKGKIKDKQIDDLRDSILATFDSKQKALGKIGLEESQISEIRPIFLPGWTFGDGTLKKLGKDGIRRSSRYALTWLFFGSDQIFMHRYEFSILSDMYWERTEEFFYKDIVSISTFTEALAFDDKKATDDNNNSGEILQMFQIVVPNDKFSGWIEGNVEASIQAMKRKIREKKRQG